MLGLVGYQRALGNVRHGGGDLEEREVGGRDGGESGRQNKEADVSFPHPRICKLETVTQSARQNSWLTREAWQDPFFFFPVTSDIA